MYPKGDEQIKGDDYISLYLEIIGIQKLRGAWKVNALLNFFVYDYNKEQYVSFQGNIIYVVRFK